MKSLKFAFVLLIAGGALISCSEKSAGPPPGPPAGPKPFAVTTLPTETVTSFTEYPARIEGIVDSEVRAKIAGYVTDVLVDEGQLVRKGQLLFRLETATLNQDAAAASANVNAAQVEVDKLKPLVEKNIISEVQLRTAEARLMQAQSGLSGIDANINYGRITSPTDGNVGRITSRKGALVTPATQQPLTTIADISKVYAYFSLNEGDYLDVMQRVKGETTAEKIENMPPVDLVLSNGSTYDQQGKIETIINQVNAETGTVQFRAIFDNPARLLNDGNSGTIRVPRTFTDAIVVPKTATYDQQGRTYVYLVGADSLATAAGITVQSEAGNLFVVSQGVKAGDRIVATGIDKLKAGDKIQPREMPFDSIAKPLPTVFR